MLLCPDCRNALPGGEPGDCSTCGWKLEEIDGIPVLLSSEDRRSPVLSEYLETYDRIADDDLGSSLQPSDYLVEQADLLSSYFPRLDGMRVCDIGLGQGMVFDRLLAAHPAEATAVDISLEYLRRYAPKARGTGAGPVVKLVRANVETLPYSEEFDFVVASELLEHVLNFGDALISLHRSLAAGGQLVVRVPLDEDLRQYARQNGCPYPFVHLRSFTRKGLVQALGVAGFRARRVWLDGHFPGRPRALPRRLDLLAAPVRRRLYARRRPTETPLSSRLLLEPVTLTGLFEKA